MKIISKFLFALIFTRIKELSYQWLESKFGIMITDFHYKSITLTFIEGNF